MLGSHPLKEVLERARAHKDQLEAIYSVPVLLVAPESKPEPVQSSTLMGSDPDDDEDSKVKTISGADLPALRTQAGAAGAGRRGNLTSFDDPQTLVVPVQRRLAKSKEVKISFGRASICDLVLGYASVSKHHGYLEEREGVWHIFDVGSMNGIALDGKRVPPLGALLRDGSVIELGTVAMRFLSAQAFVQLLRLKLA